MSKAEEYLLKIPDESMNEEKFWTLVWLQLHADSWKNNFRAENFEAKRQEDIATFLQTAKENKDKLEEVNNKLAEIKTEIEKLKKQYGD